MEDLFVKYKVYMVVTVIILVGLGYYFLNNQSNHSSNQTIKKLEKNVQLNVDQTKKIESQPKSQPIPVVTIMVDIKGQIKKPGVYQSNQGERVIDVINRAGGLTDKADESQINFAAHVQDEMVITIPLKGQINNNPPVLTGSPVQTASASSSGSTTNKINLNRADESELQNLPGIGPSKATAIISYRNENGPFQTIDDLKKISGIGDKVFEKLKDSIIVQ